jgi:hypothetical protein
MNSTDQYLVEGKYCVVCGEKADVHRYAFSSPDKLEIAGPICNKCDTAICNCGYSRLGPISNGFRYSEWILTNLDAYMALYEQYTVRKLLELL